MARTVTIAATTTLLMEVNDVSIKDLETRAFAPLTEPDSVTFKVYDEDGVEVGSIEGNQAGTTASWNATYDFDTKGEYTWQAVIVKDDTTLTTRAIKVLVV